MKKAALSRLLKFALIGFTTFSAVSWISSCAPTQPVGNAVAWSSPISTSSLIWPTQGTISQGFHTFHEGIDVAGPTGTPVLAAAAGEVILSGWDDWGLGNAVELKHSDGSRTVYGHNSRLLVRKGDQVSQGQAIAEMGSSGNSTGPHLHFEVHPGGRQAVDPMSLLPALVAGKIPTSQSVAAAPTPVTLPEASRAITVQGGCNGEAVIDGETANFRVRICRENGQFVYIGQPKQNPGASIRLLARSTGQGRYRADNGSYSYHVSRERVEVLQNGRQIRSEQLYNQSSDAPGRVEAIASSAVPPTSVGPEPLTFDIAPAPTPTPMITKPAPKASVPRVTARVCGDETVIEGETVSFYANVCRENGRLFYVRRSKQAPSDFMLLPARRVGEGRYRADEGSYSYVVSSERVEVLRNGRQIRSEAFGQGS